MGGSGGGGGVFSSTIDGGGGGAGNLPFGASGGEGGEGGSGGGGGSGNCWSVIAVSLGDSIGTIWLMEVIAITTTQTVSISFFIMVFS